MKNFFLQLLKLVITLVVIMLMVGCKARPSPSSLLATPPISVLSVLPTPPALATHNKILLLFSPADASARARLEISDPDGKGRQLLAEVAPEPSPVAISSDQQYAAFFTSDTASEGALVVHDLQRNKSLFQQPVPAEISESFRDAWAVRYLAWSPDDKHLAGVMNRNLYLVSLDQQEAQVLVHYREARYTLAGMVKGSVGHPTWSSDGKKIIYDAFSPPDILTSGADRYRNIESVDVSSGVTATLLTEAHIMHKLPNEQKLILKHKDGLLSLLDLTTLEIGKSAPLTETVKSFLCVPQSNKCASIISGKDGQDVLRLELAPQAGQVHDLRTTELDKSASDCQFQSVLWSPGDDTLLVTMGCAERVSLWSIGLPDLETTHLIDWTGVGVVRLLTWFE